MRVKIISMDKLKKIAYLDSEGDYQPNFETRYYFPRHLFRMLGKTYNVVETIKARNTYFNSIVEEHYVILLEDKRRLEIPFWYVDKNVNFELE